MGAGVGSVSNFDEIYAESITDANLTMEIDNAGGLTFDLTAGNFIIGSTGTFATFDSTGFLQLDNLKLDGNTLSTTNTNGNLTLDPNGTGGVIISPGTTSGVALSVDNNPLTTGTLLSLSNDTGATLTGGIGLDIYLGSSSSTAGQTYGQSIVIEDSGFVSSGTEQVWGSFIDVTKIGASGGNVYLYGQEINSIGDAFTSQTFGLNVSAANGGNSYGVYSFAELTTAATMGDAYAVQGTVRNASTGTIEIARAGYFNISNENAGGTILDAYGAYISANNAGTIDTLKGLYITDLSSVATTSYNLYTEGATAKHYIAGNLGIGKLVPTQKLDITGNATISGTLALGPIAPVAAGTCDASAKGKQYMNGVDNKMYYCNGTAWTEMGGSTGPGGAVNFDEVYAESVADGNLTMDISDAGGLTYAVTSTGNFAVNLSSTGDFVINDGVSDLMKFNDDGTIDVVSAATTADAIDITLANLTEGAAIDLNINALTSGDGLRIVSTSTALTTGSLIDLLWNPSGSTEIFSTGDLFKIDLGQYANALNVFALYDNAVKLFSVSQTKITSALPHEFTAAGDVSMAYDLVMTNQTSSLIDSYGPLTVSSGESFENNNLTLRAYGTGAIVVAGSGLSLETGEKLMLDSNDSGDTYLTHDNTNNWLGFWVDGSEEVRFLPTGTNSIEANRVIAVGDNFDIAETYPTFDETLVPGDLVMIDTANDSAIPAVVKKGEKTQSNAVIGIVSTSPGFTMGSGSFAGETCTEVIDQGIEQYLIDQRIRLFREEAEASASAALVAQTATPSAASASARQVVKSTVDEQMVAIESAARGCTAAKQVLVALAGRVPVKVSTENGPILPGDYLTQSSEPGVAMKATNPGIVVGKALESYDGLAEGKVMAFVNLSYFPGASIASPLTATRNVTLTDTSLPADLFQMAAGALIINGDVSVTKTLFASDVYASSSLSTGIVQIDGLDGSISTKTGDLRLQTGDALGNVDIFNGLLVFTPDGGIVSQSDIQANRVKAEELVVLGAATEGEDSSIGNDAITEGSTTTTISNSLVKSNSKIFVTPTAATGGQGIIVESKIDGAFTVSIDHAHSADITFDYWIVGVEE
jgi:hypothetical protein